MKRRKFLPGRSGGWKVPAIVGGGVLIVVVAIIIAASSDTDEPVAPLGRPRPPPPRSANTPPRRVGVESGASVLQGPIDDRTTSSPLGNQHSITVPLERRGDLLLAAVKVNGVNAGKFLIDTGVRDTIVSTELADRLKLAEDGRTGAVCSRRKAIGLEANISVDYARRRDLQGHDAHSPAQQG